MSLPCMPVIRVGTATGGHVEYIVNRLRYADAYYKQSYTMSSLRRIGWPGSEAGAVVLGAGERPRPT